MTILRKLKYDSGKLAIYDYDDASPDDNPFTSPLSNISRLQFHSDLEYPKVIGTYTGSLSLASVSNNQFYTHEHVIAAHGRGGTPYVEGKLQIGSVWRPFAGHTVVAQQNISGLSNSLGFIRALALGANGTNIVVEEFAVTHLSGASSYPTLSVPYVIWLLDTLL